jgi:hypothetical protein
MLVNISELQYDCLKGRFVCAYIKILFDFKKYHPRVTEFSNAAQLTAIVEQYDTEMN